MATAGTPDPGRIRFICDHCLTDVLVALDARPELPWRIFSMVGWAGDFHACDVDCEEAIRQRAQRP